MSTLDPGAPLSPEAALVLEAVSDVSVKLDEAKTGQEKLRAELKQDARDRIKLAVRQVISVVVIAVVLLAVAFTGYVQYDRVTRCHARADTIATIKDVLKKDHEALPEGLRAGFPESPDLERTVSVIEKSYDVSERQIDLLLPEPDCSGFLP